MVVAVGLCDYMVGYCCALGRFVTSSVCGVYGCFLSFCVLVGVVCCLCVGLLMILLK